MGLEIPSQIILRFGGEWWLLRGFILSIWFQRRRHNVRFIRMQMLLQLVLAIESLAARLAFKPLLRHVDGFNVTLQLVLSGESLRTFNAFKVPNVRVSRNLVTFQTFASAKRLFTEFAVDPRFQPAAHTRDDATTTTAPAAVTTIRSNSGA